MKPKPNARAVVVMIRTIVAVIVAWSFAGVLHAECVLVPPRESSSHVRVSVVLGGKPLAGAKVILRNGHECNDPGDVLGTDPLYFVTAPPNAFPMTDEKGILDLRELAPGEYDVAATLNGIVTTPFVALHVSSDPKLTTLPMDLTGQLQRVEDAPIRDRVAAFQGTVQDPAEAVIAGASIVVVKKGSQMKDVALTTKSDNNGHFSAQLAEGSYLAVFYFRAFRPRIVPCQVVKGGSGELTVKLDIGRTVEIILVGLGEKASN
jgi:hypothetical protein